LVPYHKPIPGSKDKPPISSGIGAWVEAEKLMNLAFVLPCSVLICWGIGVWVDHLLHQKWIGILGIIVGSVCGLIYVIQQAIAAEKKAAVEDQKTSEPTDQP
jgi:F0F1-type ATP synthase assembly protein I